MLHAHFARTAELRLKLLEEPTQYMIAHAYFCDRLLDKILHAIGSITSSMNQLTHQLKVEANECATSCKLTERMYLEVEARTAKAKATEPCTEGMDSVITNWKEK